MKFGQGESRMFRPEQKTPCIFFKRNACTAGARCSFLHANPVRRETPACRYYVKSKCLRSNCKFLHWTREEEEHYMATGMIPETTLLKGQNKPVTKVAKEAGTKLSSSKGSKLSKPQSSCSFIHSSSVKIKTESLSCHDYAQNNCFRSTCKFFHWSPEEEKQYAATGKLPNGYRRNESGAITSGVATRDKPLTAGCSNHNKPIKEVNTRTVVDEELIISSNVPKPRVQAYMDHVAVFLVWLKHGIEIPYSAIPRRYLSSKLTVDSIVSQIAEQVQRGVPKDQIQIKEDADNIPAGTQTTADHILPLPPTLSVSPSKKTSDWIKNCHLSPEFEEDTTFLHPVDQAQQETASPRAPSLHSFVLRNPQGKIPTVPLRRKRPDTPHPDAALLDPPSPVQEKGSVFEDAYFSTTSSLTSEPEPDPEPERPRNRPRVKTTFDPLYLELIQQNRHFESDKLPKPNKKRISERGA